MNTVSTSKFKVWGLLALPLAAVIVVALMFAWGHGSSQRTEAVGGANSPDAYIGAAGCANNTSATGAAKCSFGIGSAFTVQARLANLGANFPMGTTGYQTDIGYSAGLVLKNRPGTGEVNAACSAIYPIATITAESKGASDVTEACAAGIGQGPVTPAANALLSELDLNCSAVPGVQTVVLIHGVPLNTNFVNDLGVSFADPDAVEVLTVNCIPAAQSINVNITNAAGGGALSGTCVLVFAQYDTFPNGPLSPPVAVNQPIDVVSDNNAIAACDATLGGPLSDSNPANGAYNISISGALRLQYGDVWHVQQVVASTKYALDNTKNICPSLALGKCTINIANNQVTGTITTNFFLNPPGGGAPTPLTSADGVAENCRSIDAGAPVCTTASSIVSGQLPIGPHTVTITSCENGLTIDEKGGAQPATAAVTIGFPTKQPSVAFHCASPDMFNLKLPSLANLFMTAQGPKLDPANCAASTDDAVFSHVLSNPPASADPKGLDSRQVVNGFEFDVWFDEQWICVNLNAGAYVTNNGLQCIIDDKNDGQQLDGWARIGCFGPKLSAATVDESDMTLATITVSPEPELYSQIVANQDNGIAVQILNKGCNLTDQQGEHITKFVAGLPAASCDDSAVTIRWLECDVNGDGAVTAADAQILSFRWGARVGSLAYNQRFDLEPSGTAKFDGDIDIKDVQFCFGRLGSTIAAPHPPQLPVNPKIPNP